MLRLRPLRALAILAAGVLPGACGGEAPRPLPTGVAKRVVSLAPSHTELLFALGAGDAVVGVTRFCDRPPEARTRTVVGDARSLSLETLASLEPDLVVLNAEGVASALGPLRDRLRVLSVSTDTLPQLLDAVGILGAAVGKDGRAKALRAEMEGEIARARERNAARTRTRVLLVVQREPFFVAGGASYVDALLRAIGCENAASDLAAPWPTLSAESLLQRDPDAIIDASFDRTGAVAEWWTRRFPTLAAGRAGRVRALADDAAVRPGPGVAAALRTLEEAVR
jgi:iron complex transport system substrate-binding protein